MSDAKQGVNWKETILLPTTGFDMRANLAQREPDAIARWESEGLYQRMVEGREGATPFVMHDGPPYANGEIHHGHALNKILKDIVVRHRTLAGHQCRYVPGWDCHGLPIEQKVDEQLGKAKRDMDAVAFRRACRDYAAKYVDVQREGFQRLMVLGEWDDPYLTMSYGYEATIARTLGRFMELGYVYKGMKPVHWSWAAVTALADAEVEYAAYTAPSVYVKFALPEPPAWLAEAAGGREVNVVIWTTTPWTLPSNVAIVLHPQLEYRLLALDDSEAIVVATGRQEHVVEACGLGDLPVLTSFDGVQLVGDIDDADPPRPMARHPFIDRGSVLLPADYVTLEQGTGCVHTAPGHGEEDFATGRKYGLDVLAPVDQYGKYTAGVPDYVGMHVFKANPIIAQRLADTGRLLNSPDDRYVVDRYPHCWRTKKPLIFRATVQWFADVDHEDLRARSLAEVEKTQWVPPWGENRIRAMLEGRPDWCLSRQRAWGVPITAFRCTACDGDVVSHEVAYHVADLFEQGGADVWFEKPATELVPDGFACPHCGGGPEGFEKVEDILDVWFDSGVSWAAVLRERMGVGEVADLYLEGSDQHRGWFQHSLLPAVATTGSAPFKAVLTHGFVVDEKGHKYSKSSPNFEPLKHMIDQHGAEIVRLWVSMVDYRNDMVLAPELLKHTSGAYRKIRNTIRFLLGNLEGYNPDTMPLSGYDLTDIDRWALARTADFTDRVRAAYDAYEFHVVFHTMLEFCNEHMSAIYLDVLKDRMYCEHPDDPARRAGQAVMYEALRRLLIAASPILSFTADEAWGHLPRATGDVDNVALADFPTCPDAWRDAELDRRMARRLELRSRMKEAIEAKRPKKKGEREPGQIGSSQEAVVRLTVAADQVDALAAEADALAELAIVASVHVAAGTPSHDSGVDVDAVPSGDARCERCWNHRPTVGASAEYPTLCSRCVSVVERVGPPAQS